MVRSNKRSFKPIVLVSIASLAATTALVAVSGAAQAGVTSGSITFLATGAPQSWTTPVGVTSVHVDAFGAQGGGTYGGFGGWVQADLRVSDGQVLDIEVGSTPPASDIGQGGYNGGGSGTLPCCKGSDGGGATDIRPAGGDLSSRFVVAAGGGGGASGPTVGMGGSAGLLIGEGGADGTGYKGGTGATGDAPGTGGGAWASDGSIGSGGSAGAGAGSGGGGYFGGGGGGGDSYGGSAGGGGAGSSYAIPGATSAVFTQGVEQGDGRLVLSWGGAAGASFSTSPGLSTFLYTAGPQLWQVPLGQTMVAADVSGAGGQGVNPGLGQEVTSRVPATPGQMLAVMVGGKGSAGGTFRWRRGEHVLPRRSRAGAGRRRGFGDSCWWLAAQRPHDRRRWWRRLRKRFPSYRSGG